MPRMKPLYDLFNEETFLSSFKLSINVFEKDCGLQTVFDETMALSVYGDWKEDVNSLRQQGEKALYFRWPSVVGDLCYALNNEDIVHSIFDNTRYSQMAHIQKDIFFNPNAYCVLNFAYRFMPS